MKIAKMSPMLQKLLFVFLFFSFNSWAQRFQVLDSNLHEGIAFAKVYPELSAPLLTDINGYFELSNTNQSIRIRALGYHDTTIVLANLVSDWLYLRSKTQETQEIVVVPGVNPALRIMEQAIQNRKANHPQAHGGFIADQYSKFIFDLDDATRRKMADTIIAPTDTSNYEFKKFVDQQAFFISETKSSHYFEPPYREKEIIEAFRVSGFSDPALSSIAQGLQSFHFYEIQLEILGLKYLSPLAPGSLNRYFYSLKDTTINGSDTTFTIFFKPKKGTDFEGLTGQLYINTNGYAIEKVKAMPYNPPPSANRVAIIQEYQLIDANKWFPKQLSTEIYLPFIQLTFDSVPAVIVGKGLNVVKAVRFNPAELDKVKFQQIAVETLPNAAKKLDDQQWDSVRVEPLSEREIMTFKQIDSLSKAQHFDEKLKIAKVLLTGKIPLGYFQIDATRFLKYNAFERTRIGLGLETSARLSKHLTLGGQFGYGLNDARIKYGAYVNWQIGANQKLSLKGFRSLDIAEVGGPIMYQTSLFYKQDVTRYLYATNMAYQDKLGLELSARIQANKRLEFETSLQRNNYTDAYAYAGQTASQVLVSRLGFSWAIREKSSFIGDVLLPKSSPYPKIQLQFEHAWYLKDWTSPDLVFNRLQINIFQLLTIPGTGILNWNARFAVTDRATPLLYQNAISASRTYGQWMGISVANTFETLSSTAFYHQTQLQLFARFILNSWRTKASWNEPQLGCHYAFGWGTMSDQTVHSTTFLTMNRGYQEAGVLLNGLYVSGQSSFGIGVFSSFGYYASKDWKQNIVPKFSLGYVF